MGHIYCLKKIGSFWKNLELNMIDSHLLENFVELIGVELPEFGSVNDGGFGLAWVNFRDGNVQAGGNIFNSFVAFRDNSYGFGNSFGSDRVVTGYHDNLQEKVTGSKI